MDHSFWNKYGASLANMLRSEDAIGAYKQALELRPVYVRSFVNMGLAFENSDNYMAAAENYLNGIILNPKAIHIWSQVRQALIQAKRGDLLNACEMKDLNAMKAAFPNLVNPGSMAKPSMDTLYENKIFQ